MSKTSGGADSRFGWLWFGFTVMLAYGVLVTVFINQYEVGFIQRLAALELNAIGDFLAGVFAPLAFLWLFVATMMQSEELKLQRYELVESRAVMMEQAHAARAQANYLEAQATAMKLQTSLLGRQVEIANQTAKKNFRVMMYERRLAVYDVLMAISERVEEGVFVIDGHFAKTIEGLVPRSFFIFDREVTEWLDGIGDLIGAYRTLGEEIRKNKNMEKIGAISKDELARLSDDLGIERSKLYREVKARLRTEPLHRFLERHMSLRDIDTPDLDERINVETT